MNGPTDERIELEKLALERDKLQFEREKFAADDDKRRAEVEQLKSDAAKTEAERQKTMLEKQDLERPWYKRETFLTSLSLPLIIVTLVTGTLTYIAGKDTRQLQVEKASLSSEITGLKDQTNLAQMRVSKAEEESKSLQAQNSTASQTYKQLLEKEDSLNVEIKKKTAKITLLQNQLVTGNMSEFIKLVEQASAKSNEVAIRSYLSQIKSELQVGSRDLIARKRLFLQQEANDPGKPANVRDLLRTTLSEAP